VRLQVVARELKIIMRFVVRSFCAPAFLLVVMLAYALGVSPGLADSWREGSPMTTARANAGGVLVGEDLYVIGGSGTSGPRAMTEIYDTRGDIWRSAAPLPVGLEQFGIAATADKIFVAGGFEVEGGSTLISESAAFWIYDIRTGSWNAAPDMPGTRVGLSLAAVGDKIYAIGGRGSNPSRVYVFDLGKAEWTTLPAANPSPRSAAASVVVGDDIYLIGGASGGRASARVDILDASRGVWRSGPSLPSPREGHVAALLDGAIHVSGGQSVSPPKTYPEHFVLDVKKGQWRKASPLPTPRHGAIAAATDNKLFVVGGAPGAGVYTVFTSSDIVDIYTGN
tara:strand:+ start:31023 stop:32036 length:1014 start_codon:yes stop_codon:yes gene_type:complete